MAVTRCEEEAVAGLPTLHQGCGVSLCLAEISNTVVTFASCFVPIAKPQLFLKLADIVHVLDNEDRLVDGWVHHCG